MTNSTPAFTEEEATVLDLDIPDELLESTAQTGELNAFTLGSCTGLSVCPG